MENLNNKYGIIPEPDMRLHTPSSLERMMIDAKREQPKHMMQTIPEIMTDAMKEHPLCMVCVKAKRKLRLNLPVLSIYNKQKDVKVKYGNNESNVKVSKRVMKKLRFFSRLWFMMNLMGQNRLPSKHFLVSVEEPSLPDLPLDTLYPSSNPPLLNFL